MKNITKTVEEQNIETLAAALGVKTNAKSRDKEELRKYLTARPELLVTLKDVNTTNAAKFRLLADEHNFTVKEISITLGAEPTIVRQSLMKRPTGARAAQAHTAVSAEDFDEAMKNETIKARVICLIEKKYSNVSIATALAIKPQRVSMIKTELNVKSNALI